MSLPNGNHVLFDMKINIALHNAASKWFENKDQDKEISVKASSYENTKNDQTFTFKLDKDLSQRVKKPTLLDPNVEVIAAKENLHPERRYICFQGSTPEDWKTTNWFILPTSWDKEGSIPHGFKIQWDAIKENLKKYVDDEIAKSGQSVFIISGYSLGAALATYTAYYLVAECSVPWKNIRLITYSSPQVGDTIFISGFNNTYRGRYAYDLWGSKDPIRHLDVLSNYNHIKNDIRLENVNHDSDEVEKKVKSLNTDNLYYTLRNQSRNLYTHAWLDSYVADQKFQTVNDSSTIFDLEAHKENKFGIKDINEKYMSAQNAGLVNRKSDCKDWEIWRISDPTDGLVNIQCRPNSPLPANQWYLSYIGGSGILCTKGNVDAWEEWEIALNFNQL